MNCIFGYGSLMNFFSAMKSLNNLESKICVIPCKIKNRIFYHESSITQEYNIKRSANQL